jgi:hypothetical protein
VAVLGLTSCAQKGFPPGGPEDRTPPTLITAFPDSGATGVELGSAITLLFSEKMNRRSVEGAFRLAPPSDLESLHWEKNSLTLLPAQGLLPDKTYTLILAAGMKDGRGNRTREPSVIHFSTGDSLPPGRLEGSIITGRMKSEGVMVWAFSSESCPPSLGETPPAGAGQVDAKGKFFVGALSLGRSYCLYAHYDIDRNGEVDEGDFLVEADSLVTITVEEQTLSGIEIYLVAEDEPGSIAGTVVDSARVAVGLVGGPVDTTGLSIDSRGGNSMRVGFDDPALSREAAGTAAESRVQLPDRDPGTTDSLGRGRDLVDLPADSAVVFPDSGTVQADTAAVFRDPVAIKMAEAESVYLGAPVIVVVVDVADSANFVQDSMNKGGTFTLSKVSPGTYRLEVFRDLDGDRRATPGVEPVAAIENIIVRPVRKTDVGELILRWPESVRLDELRDMILEGKAPWQKVPRGENRERQVPEE